MQSTGDVVSSAQTAGGPLVEGTIVSERYELVRELGRGAAGVVWLATHRLLTTQVAVKFLEAASADADVGHLVERFRFEAQVSARLAKRTDRIVAVHDGGMFEGRPFIVMDFVEGKSVEDVIDNEGMAPAEVAVMIADVAQALEACHAESIAHRDIKPANVLRLADAGRCQYKLGDFGIAKLFGAGPKGLSEPRRTSEQMLVGSPAYMSPETISGETTTTGAADVWALAVTAYEALTRRLPFDAETAWPGVALAIVARNYALPSRHLGPQARALDAVFARAFGGAVEDRYGSATELSDALGAAIAELGAEGEVGGPYVGETAPTLEPEPSAPPMHRPRWLVPVAIAAILLAVATIVGFVASSDSVGPSAQARPPVEPAVPGPNPTATAPVDRIETSPVEPVPDEKSTSAPIVAVRPRPPDPAPVATALATAEPTPTATEAPAATETTSKPKLPKRPIDPSEIQ